MPGEQEDGRVTVEGAHTASCLCLVLTHQDPREIRAIVLGCELGAAVVLVDDRHDAATHGSWADDEPRAAVVEARILRKRRSAPLADVVVEDAQARRGRDGTAGLVAVDRDDWIATLCVGGGAALHVSLEQSNAGTGNRRRRICDVGRERRGSCARASCGFARLTFVRHVQRPEQRALIDAVRTESEHARVGRDGMEQREVRA